MKEIRNKNLGYNEVFELDRQKLGSGDLPVARVVAEYKGGYKVKNAEGEYFAKVTGKRMYRAASREDYPAVGDWVMLTEVGEDKATIEDILPRHTVIKRKHGSREKVQIIATNIDMAFIVESVGRNFNLNRFERYITIVSDGGVKPMLILNKVDLADSEDLDRKMAEIKERFKDVPVLFTSALDSTGLEELRESIKAEKTYCFLGSSGVGKSSLINKLLEENAIETNDISVRTDRGKHTTTSREMYFLENGGIVIDNPGVREVGMTSMTGGVEETFDEMEFLAKECKFSDCSHILEPKCGVLRAVKEGEVSNEKYKNYIGLKKETDFYEMSEVEKREKDQKFGKFIKNAKKDIKKYKNN